MKIELSKKELALFLTGLNYLEESALTMLNDNGHLLNDLAFEDYKKELKAIANLRAKFTKEGK